MSYTCLCLPQWYSFTVADPGGMEGLVDFDANRYGILGFNVPHCEVAQTEIRTCNPPIANPALYHTAVSAPKYQKLS